jgi:SSS family solute:Na+ symporter
MNFLHYAVLMFVVCTVVLIGVSMLYPAPSRKKLAGLTFATVGDRIESMDVKTVSLQRETRKEHQLNLAFTFLLIITVFVLWIHFR